MKKYVLIVLLIIMGLISSMGYTTTRYMWCWKMNNATDNIGSARTDLFNFCAAPLGDITKAVKYLYYDPNTTLVNDSTNIYNFLADAHSHGLKVLYVTGTWTWVSSQLTLSYGKATMDAVIAFNTTVSDPNQRFDGVEYDLRPDYDASWFSNESAYWTNYTSMLVYCQAKVSTYNVSYSPPLYFEPVVSYYYGTNGDPTSNNVSIQTTVDSVAVMNFFNTASNLTTYGMQFLNYADAIGKKVVIGVEVSDINLSSPMGSFFSKGNVAMESTLAIAESVYTTHPSYQGIAIEYYDEYRTLPTGGFQGWNVCPQYMVGDTTTPAVFNWTFSDSSSFLPTGSSATCKIKGGSVVNWVTVPASGLPADTNHWFTDAQMNPPGSLKIQLYPVSNSGSSPYSYVTGWTYVKQPTPGGNPQLLPLKLAYWDSNNSMASTNCYCLDTGGVTLVNGVYGAYIDGTLSTGAQNIAVLIKDASGNCLGSGISQNNGMLGDVNPVNRTPGYFKIGVPTGISLDHLSFLNLNLSQYAPDVSIVHTISNSSFGTVYSLGTVAVGVPVELSDFQTN